MEYVEITNSQFKEGLKTRRNMMVFGLSGYGKTATVEEYAEENGLKIAYCDMAGQLPESIAGIPAVIRTKVTEVKDYTKEIASIKKDLKTLNDKLTELALADTLAETGKPILDEMIILQDKLKTLTELDGKEETYYRRMLDVELEQFFKDEGEGWILFFDEINQGSPESLNTLYSITHPNPKMRRWAGHNMSKCQIVACGNLSDGSDGTVYLTDLPTPLLNRFFVFKLKPNKKDATDYLKKKYKNIPQVAKYIKVMLDNNIAPRDVDLALDILQYDHDGIFLEAKLGTALTAKIYDLQKGIKNLDPAELLKNARKVYEQFMEDGEVMFGAETITTEEELKSKFTEFLSDEEIAGIFKGGVE